MHVAPHEDFARIAAGLEAGLDRATAWEGMVYRSAAPRYSGDGDIVTGIGSLRMGGRWNPPGCCRTVYASLDPETAMKEALATFRYYGWALYDAMPRVFRALDIRFARVGNLRQRRMRKHLAPWLKAVLAEDWRSLQASEMKICMQNFLTVSWRRSTLDPEEEAAMSGKRSERKDPEVSQKDEETMRTLRQIRDDLGLTQAELARLLGFSTRWVATQEASGIRADAGTERRLLEVARLVEALSRVVQPEGLRGWFIRPNAAFQGLKPLEVVERGQIDRLWQMIFFLESGVAS